MCSLQFRQGCRYQCRCFVLIIMKNNHQSYLQIIFLMQYFIASGILLINLIAHVVFWLNENKILKITIGEWAQAWWALYPLIWILPLIYLLVFNVILKNTSPVPTRFIIALSVSPLTLTLHRLVRWLSGNPLILNNAISCVFLSIQTILLFCFFISLIQYTAKFRQ